jgi:SAM-dependent methyltransferase
MSSPPDPPTSWASGSAYEAYVGRWSALVAPEFLGRLGVEPDRRWLDVGCGTGILTRAILAGAAPTSVIGVDPSEPFLEHARAATVDPRALFRVGSADATGLADDSVDAVVSGLVLNFVADVAAALGEAIRVAVPGGMIGGYVWDYANGMQFIRAFWDAAVALDRAAAPFDQGGRHPIAAPGPLRAAFVDAGLSDVVVEAIEIPTTFTSFEDLWTPFTGGTGQAPAYLATLGQDRVGQLRERLRSSLPIRPDGQIRLSARAWSARGRAPGVGA